jgi:hypothetical protein
MAGLIFHQLLEKFPFPRDVDIPAIASAMGVSYQEDPTVRGLGSAASAQSYGKLANGASFFQMLEASLDWLESESFIVKQVPLQGRTFGPGHNARLTAKALAAMYVTPIDFKKPLGAKLTDAVKGAGTEAGRAAIGETVGQIVGAAARSFFGGPAA